jgi:hypothetical protein
MARDRDLALGEPPRRRERQDAGERSGDEES